MKGLLVVAMTALLIAPGCVTAGKNFDSNVVKRIINNKTTKSQIQGWFGYPYMTGRDNGDESWNYHYTEASTSSSKSKDLYIVFDDDGVVKKYTFSTGFPNEMSVAK